MADTLLAKRSLAKKDVYEKLMKAIYDNPQLAELLPEMAFFECSKTDWTHLFTNRRIELICLIEKKKPKNLSELAALSKRSIENVHRDLKILERFNLVSLKKRGRETIPLLEKKAVMVMLG